MSLWEAFQSILAAIGSMSRRPFDLTALYAMMRGASSVRHDFQQMIS
jgi:hypothetical protein